MYEIQKKYGYNNNRKLDGGDHSKSWSVKKKVLLEAELIISSDDLDEEYEMLQKKYGKEIDNIEFFMYIKRRVNAAYNKESFLILFMVFLLFDHSYGPGTCCVNS